MDCNFNREFEDGKDIAIVLKQKCFVSVHNSKTKEWKPVQEWDTSCKSDSCSTDSVKDNTHGLKGEHAAIQYGVLSHGPLNTKIGYDHEKKEVTIWAASQYTGEVVSETGPVFLELKEGEYISGMYGNSQWFEIQIRKKSELASPRRVFGSSTFDKLIPDFVKPDIDLKKDSYIVSCQNAQTSSSKFARAGFFGLNLIDRESIKLGIYTNIEYYLTINKADTLSLKSSEGSNSDEKTVTIVYTDKAAQKSVSVDLKFTFVDRFVQPEFKNDNDASLKYNVINSYDPKENSVFRHLPLKLKGDYMLTPVWKDKTQEGETPNLQIKFYPSYHTKEFEIGPILPSKFNSLKEERESYYAVLQVKDLGLVQIECDGKKLAYMNYISSEKNGSTVGVNLKKYDINCESVYARPEIKSFFTKYLDTTKQTYEYYVLKFVNKTGKGDFVIRRIYNLELFDQILSNAIEIDDYTIGTYAFDDNMVAKYQTIFSFDKTYLKIEYLNGEDIAKPKIFAIDGTNQQRVDLEIELDLVDSENLSVPSFKPDADKKKIKDFTQFEIEMNEAFSFQDDNVLVSDLAEINPKLKTSFKYTLDIDHGLISFPDKEIGYRIHQAQKDWRLKLDKEDKDGKKPILYSTLSYYLTSYYAEADPSEKKQINKTYQLQVWNQINYFDKIEEHSIV